MAYDYAAAEREATEQIATLMKQASELAATDARASRAKIDEALEIGRSWDIPVVAAENIQAATEEAAQEAWDASSRHWDWESSSC